MDGRRFENLALNRDISATNKPITRADHLEIWHSDAKYCRDRPADSGWLDVL